MLSLTLDAHNEIHIGPEIVVRLNQKQVRPITKVRIVIEAPQEFTIWRAPNTKPAKKTG